MKLSMLGNELRVFTRCITSLSKLGNDIYFEWDNNELSMRTVNSSRSAFGRFQFKSSFFENICDAKSKLIFKLPVKSCLFVFRPSDVTKNIQRCKLIFDDQATNVYIQLFCDNGISKTYKLNLIECESLQAIYSISESKNIFTSSTKMFLDVINNFQLNHDELTLTVNSSCCIWRSFVEDGDMSRVISTEAVIQLNEFEDYDISNGIEVIMSHKELRAAIAFGEQSNSKLYLSYSVPGRPFILSYAEPFFKAHFVLVTLASTNKSANMSVETRLRKSCLNITPAQLDFDDGDEDIGAFLIENSRQIEEMYLASSQLTKPSPELTIETPTPACKRSANVLLFMYNQEDETNNKIMKTSEGSEHVLVEDSDEEM